MGARVGEGEGGWWCGVVLGFGGVPAVASVFVWGGRTAAASTAMNATAEAEAGERFAQLYGASLVRGWCKCLRAGDNVNTNLAGQLRRQKPMTRILEPSDGFKAVSGGLALLLRGGAFRGSPLDDAAARQVSQLHASQSVYDKAVKPFVELGQRVRVFLTLYSDVNASQIHALYAPYAAHVSAVTLLHTGASEQITMVANAIGAFLDVCRVTGQRFDAVVLTRFDLSFKMAFPRLLGDLRTFSGVKYLWRELELGNKWRQLWKPSEDDLSRSSARDQQRLLHYAARREYERNTTFRPDVWRRQMRTADTFHAFSFAFTRCFRYAALFEMTRGWVAANKNASAHDPFNWEVSTHQAKLKPGEVYAKGRPPPSAREDDDRMINGTGGMTTIVDAGGDADFWSGAYHSTPAYSNEHLVHKVMNHWLHKTKYHLQRIGSRLGYLLNNGSFDSNPCSYNCLLNPVYAPPSDRPWLKPHTW